MACFLSGSRVELDPLAPEHAPTIRPWILDAEVTRYMFLGQYPLTEVDVRKHLEDVCANRHHALFLVTEKATRMRVGWAGLWDLHPTGRKAEFRILLGEKSCWNQGCGSETTELLLYYGFDRLNLNRIWLGVTEENAGARRAYEKAGFRDEGRLRQDLYRNSRYYDSIRMAILREDYYPERYAEHEKRFGIKRPAVREQEPLP